MGDAGSRNTFENVLTVEIQPPAAFKGAASDAHKHVEDMVRSAIKGMPAASLRGLRALRITVMA